MKHKISKLFLLVVFVFINIVVLATPSVQAAIFGGAKIPSASSIASQIEQRYHLNKESLQQYGEGLNVSIYKTNPPEVRIFFSPSDPKPGYEITAKAFPQFFANDNEALYYTWYLQRAECGYKVALNSSNGHCDKDGDGNIDEEDWKIDAMRRIANNGFDHANVIYDDAHDGDGDTDGYKAAYGGDNGFKGETENDAWRSTPEYCYVHDWQGGINYELARGELVDYDCDGTPACVEQSALICPATVEVDAEAEGGDGGSGGSGGSGGDPPSGGSAGSGGSGGSTSVDVQGETFLEYSTCEDTGLEPNCVAPDDGSTGSVVCAIGEPRCIQNVPSYSCEDSPSNVSCASLGPVFSCSTAPLSSIDNLCQHLFPLAPNNSNKNFETGDGEFDVEEEEFWTTDITDTDTAETTLSDEANVVGHGQETFTWNYQKGDKVGVVVEGTSIIPTKHDDRSSMIMWALPRNICPIKNVGAYTKHIKGYDVVIPTVDMDINSCLNKNLIDPREGGQPGNMDVSLKFYPDFPKNDPRDNDPEDSTDSDPIKYGTTGDLLNVASSINSSSNTSSHMIYDWDIQISSDGSYEPRNYDETNPDNTTAGWINIEDTLREADLIGHTTGNNLHNIPIKLNITEAVLDRAGLSLDDVFDNGVGYLKVKLEVSEYYEFDDTTRKGRSEIVIKIVSTENRITPFKPAVEDFSIAGPPPRTEKRLRFDPSDNNNDSYIDSIICEEDDDPIRKNTCFVTMNEIIGVTLNDPDAYTNFSWDINGKPLVCDTNISTANCSQDQQTAFAFFPIVGNLGDRHTITVSASTLADGEIVEFSRIFEIVEPYITIEPHQVDPPEASFDTIFKKYLGYYVDENGEQFDSYSEDTLQMYTNYSGGLEAVFHPSYIFNAADPSNSTTKLQWTIDGILQVIDIDTPHIYTLPPGDKESGDTYSASIEGIYYQPQEVRQALKDIWNISAFDSSEKYLEKTVLVEMINSEEIETSRSAPAALYASILTNAPTQILFSLQLILILIVTIGVIGFIFSLFPEHKE